MAQHNVPLMTVVAWVFWTLAILTTGANLTWPNHGITPVAILFGMGGATLHVRHWFRCLEHREMNAFVLGRDSVRNIR